MNFEQVMPGMIFKADDDWGNERAWYVWNITSSDVIMLLYNIKIMPYESPLEWVKVPKGVWNEGWADSKSNGIELLLPYGRNIIKGVFESEL